MLIISVFTGIVSCDDFLEPIDENRLTIDFVNQTPAAAEGVLLNGYNRLINQNSFTEVATDDAVNNRLSNGLKLMALGNLNAQSNPTARWINYENILWVNKFLEILDAGTVIWNSDEEINQMFEFRLRGEAHALRGLHHFYILQAHAGIGTSGELLGIPYLTEFIESDGNFNTARLSFEATVQAIINDFDEAIRLLPTDYTDNPAELTELYKDFDIDKFKVVNGNLLNLRISGRIVKALKARLALFAASPSFLNNQNYYSIAAQNAAEIFSSLGGISALEPSGVEFYTSNTNYKSGELLWRGSEQGANSTLERRMFPPSINGNGEVNPTQNFVDAFPMLDGYPATAANGYDPQSPYTNRDPRLEKYVITNGSTFAGATINTGLGGGINRIDSVLQKSTTTGYYLKKLLHPGVRLNSDGSSTDQVHFNVYFRYTELALILAEAANEIGGPDQQFEGISARDVIAQIRSRAGITQPDAYLATINTKEAMRTLIRNERRIELSFEGHRFWDLRRWGVSLNETARGYFFNGTSYIELPSVENRIFPTPYMPIPNSETLKFPEIEQNAGW